MLLGALNSLIFWKANRRFDYIFFLLNHLDNIAVKKAWPANSIQRDLPRWCMSKIHSSIGYSYHCS